MRYRVARDTSQARTYTAGRVPRPFPRPPTSRFQTNESGAGAVRFERTIGASRGHDGHQFLTPLSNHSVSECCCQVSMGYCKKSEDAERALPVLGLGFFRSGSMLLCVSTGRSAQAAHDPGSPASVLRCAALPARKIAIAISASRSLGLRRPSPVADLRPSFSSVRAA